MEQLTQGAVTRIFGMNGTDDDVSFQPTLQIINVRKVTNNGNQDRFRVSTPTVYYLHLLAVISASFMLAPAPTSQHYLLECC